MRRVFVAGGSISKFTGKGSPEFVHEKHADFGKRKNPTLEEYIVNACQSAAAATRLDPTLVDQIAVGNFCGELFSNQGHLGSCAIAAFPAFNGKPSMRVEGACASGALAFQVAVNSIRGGANVALAVGAEVQTTVAPRIGGDYLARASHYVRQRPLDDFTFPCIFARRMKHIQEKGHFTADDTAMVAAKAYANGNLNPLAHMHTVQVSLDHAKTVSKTNPTFLKNADYGSYLRLTDCSQVSDGAAAVIVASEEGIKAMGRSLSDCVEITGLVCSAGNLLADPADYTVMDVSKTAATRALQQAGVKASDLQVAEVHDCFSIAELLMYEALGIAEYGGAKNLIREGATTLGGRIPVNTGGGLLSFGHPVGATGIKQIMEIFRQMKSQCGDYQMKKVPQLGACLNMGGDDRTAVCTVLKNL